MTIAVTLGHCLVCQTFRPASITVHQRPLHRHKRSALVRTACTSTSSGQLTQEGHCVTPVAQQLAFLACPSNGLTHIFEDTAVSQLHALTAGLVRHDDDSDASPSAAPESLDALLQQQIQAVRAADQQRTVEEILYLWCLHKLAEGDLSITTTLKADQPPQGLAVSQHMLIRVMSPAVADAVVGLVGSTFGHDKDEAQSGSLTARIDRTQAAQLYAGNIEYGYFVREMEARCLAAGLSQYMDAEQLISMAGSLSEEQLRAAVRVRSRQAWHAAVRHTGLLFQLDPPAGDPHQATSSSTSRPSVSTASEGNAHGRSSEQQGAGSSLPYPQLQQTVSSANFAPAAHLAEHYSPPGAADAAAQLAASKQARGWQAAHPQQNPLPEPDLIKVQLGRLKQLLLEATVLGCVLWQCEEAVRKTGFQLQPSPQHSFKTDDDPEQYRR